MRILLITRAFPKISETFISLHAQSLRRLGCDVHVLAEPGDPQLASDLTRAGLPIGEMLSPLPNAAPGAAGLWGLLGDVAWRPATARLLAACARDRWLGRTRGAALHAVRQLAALPRDQRYDVVHAHFGNVAKSAAQLKAAGVLHAPLVVTFHGTDLNLTRAMPNRELYGRVLSQADLITVGTNHMAGHFEPLGALVKRLECVPMGIDLSRFPYCPPRGGDGQIRLACLGRLIECKGIEYAIRAVANLAGEFQGIYLDVIGDGPLQPALESLAAELGVAGRVRLHGALPHGDALAVLRQADIFVHPGVVARDGTREGQGVVLAEAQATGLPVVAGRAGGIPDAVSEGQSAILVDPRDTQALQNAIGELARDPARRAAMGAAGRAFVEEHFDQQKLSERWLQLYRELAQ